MEEVQDRWICLGEAVRTVLGGLGAARSDEAKAREIAKGKERRRQRRRRLVPWQGPEARPRTRER
jgi:hypothetical protein